MSSEPIVVLYKSNGCRHCISLSKIWDTPTKDEESVVSVLKKVYPKLRFHTFTARDNTGKFDENLAPKDLFRYGKWFPMILLIPGRLWDSAMEKLGPKNDVQLVEGVQIMNGFMENDELKYNVTYNITKPSEFGRWLTDALENEEFKRVQNNIKDTKDTKPSIIVPTIQDSNSKVIPPLHSNIVKPNNIKKDYIGTGGIESKLSNLEQGTEDICSMRIISRPYIR